VQINSFASGGRAARCVGFISLGNGGFSPKSGRAYIGTRPAKKSVAKVRRTISELTSRQWSSIDTELQVSILNRVLTGWANYFCLGPVSKAYGAIDTHVVERLRRWFVQEAQDVRLGNCTFARRVPHQKLGLKRLSLTTRDLPWARA
jgi:RNA-directed DNA polymerase